MRYLLSKIIPVPMRSKYRRRGRRREETWWQWRDHIWFHKRIRG